jgi:hypothetical protein
LQLAIQVVAFDRAFMGAIEGWAISHWILLGLQWMEISLPGHMAEEVSGCEPSAISLGTTEGM